MNLKSLLEKIDQVAATEELAENTGVTDYNPTSQGGTRKELITKYQKTKDPKDAEAARKAGATQKELQGVAEGMVGDMVVHNYTKMPIKLKPGQAQIHGWGPDEQPIYRVMGADGKEVITSNKRKMIQIAQGQGVAEGTGNKLEKQAKLISSELYNQAYEYVGNLKKWQNRDYDRSFDNQVDSIYSKLVDKFLKTNPEYHSYFYGEQDVTEAKVVGHVGDVAGHGKVVQCDKCDTDIRDDHGYALDNGTYICRNGDKCSMRQSKNRLDTMASKGEKPRWRKDEDAAEGSKNPKNQLPVVLYRELPDDQISGRDSFQVVKSQSPYWKVGETFSDDDMSMGSSQVTFKSVEQGVAEGRTAAQRERLEDLILFYGDSINPNTFKWRDFDDPEEVLTMIRNEFGDKIADQVKKGKYKSGYRYNMEDVAEGTKETSTGKVHKAEPGGYGRKFDTDEHGDEKKTQTPAVKRGRGRPKKGADSDTGEVKKWDTEQLSRWIIGTKPKTLPGKTGVKHKLKDWIEYVERAQTLTEGRMKDMLWDAAEGMELDAFLDNYVQREEDVEWLTDFWKGVNGEDLELNEISLDPSQVAAPQIKGSSKMPTTSSQAGTGTSQSQMGAAVVDFKDPRDPLKAALQQAVKNRQVTVMTTEEENIEEISAPGQEDWIRKNKERFIDQYGEEKGKKVLYATAWKRSKQVKESVENLNESTLEEILENFPHEHKACQEGWGMHESLYQALCDHYWKEGKISREIMYGPSEKLREFVEECYMMDTKKVMENPLVGAAVGAAARGLATGVGSAITNKILDNNIENEMQSQVETMENEMMNNVDESKFTKLSSKLSHKKGVKNPDALAAWIGREKLGQKEMTRRSVAARTDESNDVQMESWESQLDNLLNEGMTVTTSTGQQGVGDSVSVSATDSDAHQLMQILQHAGIGTGLKADVTSTVEPVSSDEVMSQLSSEPEDDGEESFEFLKRMLGSRGNLDQHSNDQPASEQPETDHNHDYEQETKKEVVDEEDMEEGNLFTGNLAKARAAGKEEADLDGDGDMEKVKESEHEEKCNECGMYESKCECDHEEDKEDKLNEWANSPTEQSKEEEFKTEMEYMTKLLSGGLNNMKTDQTVMPSTQVKITNVKSESISEMMKKLAGIK